MKFYFLCDGKSQPLTVVLVQSGVEADQQILLVNLTDDRGY